MSKLSESDYSSIHYFIVERGDITRWVEWEAKKETVRQAHPELVDALERLDIAERTLRAVVRSLPDGNG